MTQTFLQTTSSTNFDFSSLHLLRPEINVILKDAEVHLREFYDDQSQAPLLLDSANNLTQLAKVFGLIYFDGAAFLSSQLANAYVRLSQETDPDADNENLMIDISEAVMLLDRYVEFVLLKETPEPVLLLPVINKLREHLGESVISADDLRQNSRSITINDPAKNYTPLDSLGLDTPSLISAYRSGLSVLLSQQTNPSPADLKKINELSDVCALIASKSDTLFWQAAATLTKNIVQDLPLSHAKKRILIYLEQQLNNYLPIEDRRFADMVSFACRKDRDFATLATQKYALNQVSPETFEQMKRFLFGPNLEITQTLNTLIQEDIEAIKHKVDTLVRTDGQTMQGEPITPAGIAQDLIRLAKAMHVLGLERASQALKVAAQEVNAWYSPRLDELDGLLDKLLVAENAAIFLAKIHTPGAVKFPLHNTDISLHHLDVAYEALVKEARHNLATISAILTNFLADNHHDGSTLQDVPEMIKQVSGAAAFLHMTSVNTQLTRLANKLDRDLLAKLGALNEPQLKQITNAWADVLVAADMELENFAENRPTNKQNLLTSEHSLNYLLAA